VPRVGLGEGAVRGSGGGAPSLCWVTPYEGQRDCWVVGLLVDEWTDGDRRGLEFRLLLH
jgi:hypothetical protein